MGSPSRLTIRSLEVRPLDPIVLIDIGTEQGVVGKSYVRCYTPLALVPLARLIGNLSALLVGQSAAPLHVERLLLRHFRLLGPQGLTGAAIAGVDMALWDARARAHDLPLVTLLGGEPKPITAYASLRTMSPGGAAAEAEESLSMGFGAIKLKVGRADLAADLETIAAVRRAVGDGVRLMLDYNQSLAVADAIDRVHALDDAGVYWIEEPTRADDFDGHARIAASARTPIQLGENWWGPSDMVKSIQARASDHVMLDAMKIGGVTGWLRGAALAHGAGLLASSHTFPEFSAHLLGVTPTAHYLEYLDHVGPILERPVQIRDGHALIGDAPGAGIEWDEEAIRKLA
jgi:mandelate racemase